MMSLDLLRGIYQSLTYVIISVINDISIKQDTPATPVAFK